MHPFLAVKKDGGRGQIHVLFVAQDRVVYIEAGGSRDFQDMSLQRFKREYRFAGLYA